MTPEEIGRAMHAMLMDDVLPFWEKHSPDNHCGGYWTCLRRDGSVYDTEKYTWLQARQMWMFSHLAQTVERRDSWLDLAELGERFLSRHGRDPQGRFYYALTRSGQPFMQPFSIFSEGFAAMAYAAYARVHNDDHAREIAQHCLDQFLARRDQPKGTFSKMAPGGPSCQALSLRMILLNMLLEMQWMLLERELDRLGRSCIDEVVYLFLDEAEGILYENVAPDGSHPDTPAGRQINPGHGLEVLWMTMALAERLQYPAAVHRCLPAVLKTMEIGWDEPCGGLIYRRDARGKPLYEISWDQKMWWPHAEALITLAMAWRVSGDSACLAWLNRLWEYVLAHYVDQEHGEWFGYCNRRGEPFLDCKGNRWKGCFHVPRGLLFASRQLLVDHGTSS